MPHSAWIIDLFRGDWRMTQNNLFKNRWIYVLAGIAGILLINILDWSWLFEVTGRNIFNTVYMKMDNLGRYLNLYIKGSATVFILAVVSALAVHGTSAIKKLKSLKIPAEYILAAMVLIYVAVFSLMSYLKFSAFHAYHDMAANLEALFNIYRTGLPLSTAEGSLYELPVMNWFGIHFTPIIYLFALVAFPFRFPGGIFVLQSLFLA
jgi:hypothetical protein